MRAGFHCRDDRRETSPDRDQRPGDIDVKQKDRAAQLWCENASLLTGAEWRYKIAHRPSTVKRADRILVMDHGRIIEEGTHAGLLSRGGHYAELYNTYFRHQSLDYVEGLQSLMRTRA